MQNNFRRYNPLVDEWVIVAVNRINRPWQGAKSGEPKVEEVKSEPVGQNPLGPGAKRPNGAVNENYENTFVFDNDFPSFTEFEKCAGEEENDDLFKQSEVRGTCRVICYHPNSELTLATMNLKDLRKVVDLWNNQYTELSPKYEWVQIFENRGAVVGCSNMHPHGQLWASNYLPTLPEKKEISQKNYFLKNGTVMLMDYLAKELKRNERIVHSDKHWTILIPYWAFWPFETMILPNRHVERFTDLTEDEKQSLSENLQRLLVKYDNIFECSFPYMMGWSGAPTGKYLSENTEHWQLHCSFFPPLLRSATVTKYLAGYEVFAEKQRDMSPEAAAKLLRETSEVHYLKKE